ncbi:MAG: VCBS repeat-containing protein, partial [Chitinophagaceae bacterium]
MEAKVQVPQFRKIISQRRSRFPIFTLLMLACAGLLVNACNTRQSDTLFQKVSSRHSHIDFTNQLHYSDSLTVLDFEYMFNGAGVGLLDVNNDGLLDIFFSGNMVSARLYLNKGGMVFEDITQSAGVETEGWIYGVSIVDINQDGFADIYLCKAGNRKTPKAEMRNQFFINNGNNTFTDRAAEMGLDSDGYDIHAAFLDYDKDGDLDLYLLRNAFVNYNRNTARIKLVDGGAPSNDRLFRNDGKGKFTDVSQQAGITIEGFGLGVTVCDLNNDNWPDVYVSNDFLTNDLMWINNHDGTFTNQAGKVLKHETYNGMGNDVMDYNNDGYEDIVVVDMLPPDNKRWKLTARGNTYEEFLYGLSFGYEPQYVRNTLQLNNGNGTFSEIGQLAGVEATEWSWAPLLADFNNDGYKDLFISNGYRQDITNLDFIKYGKQANFVGTPEANRKERLAELRNYPGIQAHNYGYENQHDLTFRDASAEWGLDERTYSNGAAYGDLDNDGDLDLVINNLDQVSALYENRSSALKQDRSWIRIALKGPPGNLGAIGTKVWIWQKGKMQYQYYSPYRGYLSTVEPFLHFGIDPQPVDSVCIQWPDGTTERRSAITPRQLIRFTYSSVTASLSTPLYPLLPASQLFDRYGQLTCLHVEDAYVDFKLQPLLPKHYAHEGPGMAVGDINGDGQEDLFVGSSADHSPYLFVQQRAGFVKKDLPIVNTADNMGSLFVDVDGDQDLDLVVAQGGTLDRKKEDPVYSARVYRNDGKGNFQEVPDALKGVITSASSIAAADYDHDGDEDLFISGRINPGEYPTAPRSYLLRNDSRGATILFTDVSQQERTDLSHPGMVTSCLWTDFNNDGWQDLILVGEYMPIRFYQNQQGQFAEITASTGLEHTNGWWNGITGGDFDQDGDIDYVVGNLGLNTPY